MTEIKSTVTYDEKVIQKIVGHALENIDGLLDVSGGFFSNVKEKLINSEDVTTGVNVEVGKEEVATDLDVIVEYGKDIPAIAEGIKEIIAQNVETMTHLKVIEVNINVVDIMTRKEFEEASVTVQDRVEAGYAKTKEVTAAGYERAKEATAAGYERTKEAAQNAGEYISEKSGEARDYASEKAAQAKEFTVEKASEAKKYASEQAEKAKDAMSTDSSEGVTYTASVDGDVVVAD
ncbi:MAG: Asp23/Gls24 family envelope stress response protein [Streptococcus thoraltensis]|nr:Asp23/Gls24 family envelope stress response protein [Streptococcus thoraltensis]MDY4760970.1 Asp23/Gls24 family envelope stress response protein [Streptococcus thoraltensis]